MCMKLVFAGHAWFSWLLVFRQFQGSPSGWFLLSLSHIVTFLMTIKCLNIWKSNEGDGQPGGTDREYLLETLLLQKNRKFVPKQFYKWLRIYENWPSRLQFFLEKTIICYNVFEKHRVSHMTSLITMKKWQFFLKWWKAPKVNFCRQIPSQTPFALKWNHSRALLKNLSNKHDQIWATIKSKCSTTCALTHKGSRHYSPIIHFKRQRWEHNCLPDFFHTIPLCLAGINNKSTKQ